MKKETENYHVVAELEENARRGEVPELVAAVAEAVDALVDANHADFGERRDELRDEGVEREEIRPYREMWRNRGRNACR